MMKYNTYPLVMFSIMPIGSKDLSDYNFLLQLGKPAGLTVAYD